MAAAAQGLQRLKAMFPFIKAPLVISAPMRVFAGPALAVAVSRAGGLGFIGPGVRPTDLDAKLHEARALLRANPVNPGATASHLSDRLPVGVGFQLFDGDLSLAAAAVAKHRPVAAWLFVPANGQRDVDAWASRIREASTGIQIWLQVGSVAEAVAAAASSHAPDVLVLQGSDAGGHGLKRGAGVTALLPEVADALAEAGHAQIPLVGAGGIADGRGVAAALATGTAAGAAIGTRFLASHEADIPPGYQQDVLRVADGGQSTVRTTLFDRLQGRDDWPAAYDGRAIVNASVRDDEVGMPVAQNKELFRGRQQQPTTTGRDGWGPDGRLTAYVGSAVGLVRTVDAAEDIVRGIRAQAREALTAAAKALV